MKTQTVITTCIAFLAVGIITSNAFSRAHDKHGSFDSLHRRAKLIEQLSGEQVGKLKSLDVNYKKQLLLLKAEIQVKHLEIKQLWDAETLDADAILSKSDEVSETEKQIHQATTRHRLEVAKLLTKEQREELIKSRDAKKNRHGKRRRFREMQHGRNGYGRDGDVPLKVWLEEHRMRHGKGHKIRDMRRGKGKDDDSFSDREGRHNGDKFSGREHKKGHDRHRFCTEEIIEQCDADGDGDLSYEERTNAHEWLSKKKGDRSCCRHHETD